MKKFLSFIIAIIMIFSLTACTTNDDIRGEYEDEVSSSTQSFDTGKVNANKYINKFAGISCKLDSEWTYKTDEEIRKNNETAMGLIDEEYSEAIKNASTFTDMMATHSNQMDTITVGFEKLTGTNKLMTEASYLEATKDLTKGALESMGMTNVTITIGEAPFAGKNHSYAAISAQFNGLDVFERLVTLKCSDYMVIITVCTWQNDTCLEILNNFKAA